MILVDSSVWIGYFNGALTRQEIAVQAARNFRTLRKLGITLRKTIDTIIATRCIMDEYDLLHQDRDFEPFVTHLGLHIVN